VHEGTIKNNTMWRQAGKWTGKQGSPRTTLKLMKADDLLSLLDKMGFALMYDFFYLPMKRDHDTFEACGYALVNFSKNATALTCKQELFCRHVDWGQGRCSLCVVSWADVQGYQKTLKRHVGDGGW
jgi:hypothetical protein